MKIQELLNDKGLELTKGKVLDSDVFKFGGSDVHVIYIADTQTLIDKFKMDVIWPDVNQFEAAVTPETIRAKITIKSCQGDSFYFHKGMRIPDNMTFLYDPDNTTIPKELFTGKVLSWAPVLAKNPYNDFTAINIVVEGEILNKDTFLNDMDCSVTFLKGAEEVAAFVKKCEIIDSER